MVFQETRMPKVLGIKERVQDQAPREDRPGHFPPELSLGPQVRRTKESEFLQHHMIKMATIHVGCVEGNYLFVCFIPVHYLILSLQSV